MAKSAEFLGKPLLVTQKGLRADTFFQESAGESRILGQSRGFAKSSNVAKVGHSRRLAHAEGKSPSGKPGRSHRDALETDDPRSAPLICGSRGRRSRRTALQT